MRDHPVLPRSRGGFGRFPAEPRTRVAGVADQLSFFSAQSLPPSYDDLQGLLIGPGHVVRRGAQARVSVVVAAADRWRIDGLMAAIEALGVVGETALADVEGLVTVR